MKIVIDIPEFNNHEHNTVRRQQKFYSLPKRYKQTRDEKIDSHLIRKSCKCDANLVVEIGNHCEFIFATIQICTTFAIIFALMRICDKIRNTFAQRCQFEANVCVI